MASIRLHVSSNLSEHILLPTKGCCFWSDGKAKLDSDLGRKGSGLRTRRGHLGLGVPWPLHIDDPPYLINLFIFFCLKVSNITNLLNEKKIPHEVRN